MSRDASGVAPAVETSVDFARELDRQDPLAPLRERFEIPGGPNSEIAYLCGHSLGLMPRAARAAITAELDAWGREAVGAHFGDDGGWYAYHERFADPLARLLGVAPESVVAMNSLTTNLHLMLVSFFRPSGRRRRIVIEAGAFPSDRYAVQSQLRWHGIDPAEGLLELGPQAGGTILDPAALDALLGRYPGEVALVLLPGVQFLTGQSLDTAAYTRIARSHGAIVGLDLAHSIGNLPAPLHRANERRQTEAGTETDTGTRTETGTGMGPGAGTGTGTGTDVATRTTAEIGADVDGAPDFAVWCSYKYLNGGPGSIGGCYVHPRWHDADLPRFEGWWGHDKSRRFGLEPEFRGIGTAESWQLSNPPIFAMAPLAASLALFLEAGSERLHAKAVRLTGYLEALLEDRLGDRIELLTPRSPTGRGSQLSVRLRLGGIDGGNLVGRLAADGVVVDWREPDILRMAPVPLYNRFEDVHRAVAALHRILAA